VGSWDINNAYFKYSIWASGIATNFTKMEVRGTLRVNLFRILTCVYFFFMQTGSQ